MAFSIFQEVGTGSAESFFGHTYRASSANGIRLMISPPGGSPNMDEQGVNISPGQFSLIAITGKEIKRQPWPYSRCSFVDYEMLQLQESFRKATELKSNTSEGEENYSYTQKECRSSCLQRRIYEQCNCLDPESRLPFKNIEGRHLCGGLETTEMLMFLDPYAYGKQMCFTDPSELLSGDCGFLMKLINDLHCVDDVYKTFSTDSECNCPVACNTYEYELSISESVWPAEGYEMNYAQFAFTQKKKGTEIVPLGVLFACP